MTPLIPGILVSLTPQIYTQSDLKAGIWIPDA